MLNFTFNVDEVNVILSALSELPAKVSLGVINNIRNQAGPQLAELQAQAEAAGEAQAEEAAAE